MCCLLSIRLILVYFHVFKPPGDDIYEDETAGQDLTPGDKAET